MIKVFCPKCDKWQHIDDSYRGGIYRCDACNSLLSVPEDADPVGAAATADDADDYELSEPIQRSSTRFGPYQQGNPDDFVGGGEAYEETYDDEEYEYVEGGAEYDDVGGFDIEGGPVPHGGHGGHETYAAEESDVTTGALAELGGYDEGGFEQAPATAYAAPAPPTHAQATVGAGTPAPAGSTGTSFDGSSCTVVLIEPDTRIAEQVAEALAEFSFTAFAILPATTVAEAQQAIAEYEVDVVMTELKLADAQGMDTIKALLAITKSLPNKPPIIVHSTFSDQKGILSVLKRGVQDFVVKGTVPIKTLPRILLAAVQRQRMLVKLTQLAADQIARATGAAEQ